MVEEGEVRVELLFSLDDDLQLQALAVDEDGCPLNDGVELVASRLETEGEIIRLSRTLCWLWHGPHTVKAMSS